MKVFYDKYFAPYLAADEAEEYDTGISVKFNYGSAMHINYINGFDIAFYPERK